MVDIEKDIKDVVTGRPARPVMPVNPPPAAPMPDIANLAVTTGKRVQPEPYDRVKEHGDYAQAAAFAQALKDLMRETPNWNALSPGRKQSLEMQATKQARILHGDPDFADHWEDIAGYSLLGLRSKS